MTKRRHVDAGGIGACEKGRRASPGIMQHAVNSATPQRLLGIFRQARGRIGAVDNDGLDMNAVRREISRKIPRAIVAREIKKPRSGFAEPAANKRDEIGRISL